MKQYNKIVGIVLKVKSAVFTIRQLWDVLPEKHPTEVAAKQKQANVASKLNNRVGNRISIKSTMFLYTVKW